jgi:hypothetical protein
MPGIHRYREREALKAVSKLRRLDIAWPKAEWTPDAGNVLWWSFPVQELPYIGQPTDDAFPDHCTHWTPLVVPKVGAQ